MTHRMLRTWVPLLATLVALAPSAAMGVEPSEIAEAFDTTRLFVEPGAEGVDRPAITQSITDAGRIDVNLLVAVVAEGDADAIASAISELRSETILVFAPGSYGVASAELTSNQLEAALDAAAGPLARGDVEDGTRAFVEGLDTADSGRSLAVIAAGVLIVVLLTAVGGHYFDRIRRGELDEGRLRRRREALAARLDELQSSLGDLTGRVATTTRPEAIAAHTAAVEILDRAGLALRSADTRSALDAVARDLASAKSAQAKVRSLLG